MQRINICRFSSLLVLLAVSRPTSAVQDCSIVASSTTMIDFSTYIAGQGTSLDGMTTIQINCSRDALDLPVVYTVFISAGGESDVGLRKLRKPATSSFLNYNLYTDSLRTLIWSDSTAIAAGRGTVTGTCAAPDTNCSQPVPIYGRIPAMQATTDGQFTDDVVVTVLY